MRGAASIQITATGNLQNASIAAQIQKITDGAGLKTRRRLSTQPAWLPAIKTDDEDALLMILGAI